LTLYCGTPEFVKLVQLANLEGSSFYFLKAVKEKGAAPPREQFVTRCTHDGAFLSFACEAAASSASTKVCRVSSLVSVCTPFGLKPSLSSDPPDCSHSVPVTVGFPAQAGAEGAARIPSTPCALGHLLIYGVYPKPQRLRSPRGGCRLAVFRDSQPPASPRPYSIAWVNAASSPLHLWTDHGRAIQNKQQVFIFFCLATSGCPASNSTVYPKQTRKCFPVVGSVSSRDWNSCLFLVWLWTIPFSSVSVRDGTEKQ